MLLAIVTLLYFPTGISHALNSIMGTLCHFLLYKMNMGCVCPFCLSGQRDARPVNRMQLLLILIQITS